MATGLMAGPERPPERFASIGFQVFVLMAMPLRVFIIERASAPLSMAARAVSDMSVTFGESFTISLALFTSLRIVLTSFASRLGSVPNSSPSETLGQDTLSSSPAIDSISSSRRQTVR